MVVGELPWTKVVLLARHFVVWEEQRIGAYLWLSICERKEKMGEFGDGML